MALALSDSSNFEVVLFELCRAIWFEVAHESNFLASLEASVAIPGVDDGFPGIRKAREGAKSGEDEKGETHCGESVVARGGHDQCEGCSWDRAVPDMMSLRLFLY